MLPNTVANLPKFAPPAYSLHLQAAFNATGKCYGSRRLVAALRAKSIHIGRYKARRILRDLNIKPIWKRKFVNTTDSKHNLPVANNLLNREFNPSGPNRALTSDITYIRTRTGWLYLAVVMDLYSRRIIGWAMAPTMPAELVCRALRMAIASRQPDPGVIMHSDRGSQYASGEYQALLQQHGLICSMSRKGNCWDNAAMERFFLNLKMERVWQRDYASQMEATKDIVDYIVISSAFITACGCIPPWATLHRLTMSRKWQLNNLVGCLKLLDHYRLDGLIFDHN